ncbi:MAG: hypothetical protein FWE45_04210 [Firmicutes bacterium]|nr:hypothetical protein [Bacillota bacterium]
MLNRIEAKIMDYLFEKCHGKKTVLITPKEVLHFLMPKHELTAKQLDGHMKNLALDGYIDIFNSDNKGQLVYVVTLKLRGEAWRRERQEIRKKRMRSVGWKVALTLLGFAITFTLWQIFG